MNRLVEIFGQGNDLTAPQMACRGVLVFLIALVLIRVSGRRSFGMGTPVGNIVMMLQGSILSRAVVGTASFFPVIAAATAIAVTHRIVGLILAKNPKLAHLLEGEKFLLYENGEFIPASMTRMMVSEDEVRHALRESLYVDSMDCIEKAYMERNGKITFIKKRLG